MPLRELSCAACGHRFEALERAGRRLRCPACGGAELKAAFSGFAVAQATSRPSVDRAAAGAGCGACGDPRGPGACQVD